MLCKVSFVYIYLIYRTRNSLSIGLFIDELKKIIQRSTQEVGKMVENHLCCPINCRFRGLVSHSRNALMNRQCDRRGEQQTTGAIKHQEDFF